MGLQPSNALQLIIESSADLYAHYAVSAKILGEGAFGVVRKGKLKATGAIRAIKALSKEKLKDQAIYIKQEIEIMKMLDHPNLLMLYEVLEDDKKLYLVLEFCSGGSLQDHLNKAKSFPEHLAAAVMRQILRGTLYLHKHQICHRDLKADNCLVLKSGPLETNIVKVADFGLSCIVEPGKFLVKAAGTPTHMAPEVFAKKYTAACDVWSCGVIAHVLLSGYLPFTGSSKEDLIEKINTKTLQYTSAEWLNASQGSVTFVSKLLMKNPKQRATCKQALEDSWLVVKDRALREVDRLRLPESVIEDLRKFRSLNRLKRAALHVIASMLKDEDVAEFRKAFICLDSDGDGFFTISELKECLRKNIFFGTGPEGRLEVSWAKDEGDGFTYTEFIAATFDMKKAAAEGLCQAAFSSFDKNNDGSISISELATGKMLGQLSIEEVVETMEALDINGDAELDYTEFERMMREGK